MKPMFKTPLVSLGLLLSAGAFAAFPRDSIRINDLWNKKDTAAQLQKLGKEQEMQLFDRTQEQSGKQVRTLSGQEAKPAQRGGSPLQEFKIYTDRYRKAREQVHYRRFRGHWCGINIGFLNLANTDYTGYDGYEGFMDPDYANSITLQANILEKSISLVPRNNFGIVFGLGLEYQHIRLDNNKIAFRRGENHQIEPYRISDDRDMKKNFFKNIYLTVPLLVEFQFPAKYRKRFHAAAGVVGGIRLHTKTKQVYYNEHGNKKKNKKNDHYYVQPVKADLMAQAGYGWLHFWGSYSLTGLFQNGKGPELHPYSLGIGISF